jgi:DNA polymerase (family 10)
MTNKDLSRFFRFHAKLLELHGENPNRIRSFESVAFRLERMPAELTSIPPSQFEFTEGIGKSFAEKIRQVMDSGLTPEFHELLEKTPPGVIEIMNIKGLGPKKASVIWKEMGIASISELLYACNENRLVDYKGFGLKTQQSIQKNIEFTMNNSGKFLFPKLEESAIAIKKSLMAAGLATHVEITGALRRKTEIAECIELIAAAIDESKLYEWAENNFTDASMNDRICRIKTAEGLPCIIYMCDGDSFAHELFITTGSSAHVSKVSVDAAPERFDTEESIYRNAGMPFIAPELRENLFEFDWAKKGELPELIELDEIKGILHVHTKYSDGSGTLEEMAIACKEEGYEYIGICDHSRSAFYANGMKEDDITRQQKEIELLNARLAPFKIFKGIESDILNDGSLDYDPSVLASFDFVIASVHSNLGMSEERAMHRLIKAIENPFTTILGHPTGRLLLGREGYPIDHKKIIDACAANQVIIELNANPYRLDLDWRWIPYAIEKNVMISVNPDAHSTHGLNDTYYGICVARKGGLSAPLCFNALPVQEADKYFSQRKNSLSLVK